MRRIRALTTVVALMALVPALGTAQSARPFKNSWFWGAKGGTFEYSTPSRMNAMAPLGGLDWLITRSRGGMYISFTQAFFDRMEQMHAEGDSLRNVELKNMRRLDIAAMIFPGQSLFFRPYLGAGFSIDQVASAVPQGTFANSDAFFSADAMITQLRTSVSPVLMAGTQFQFPFASLFVQGTVFPSQKNFFLHNPEASFNTSVEAGLRFNFGSSIDR
jgi:hypothetical protein